jgi:membrane protein involved in colicin uptake
MNTPAFAGRSVALEINLAPDGTVENVTPTQPDQMVTDPVLRALANAAMRAVLVCSPLDLSAVAYQHWRNVVLIFRGEGQAGPAGDVAQPP